VLVPHTGWTAAYASASVIPCVLLPLAHQVPDTVPTFEGIMGSESPRGVAMKAQVNKGVGASALSSQQPK
jgi:hypothetical protein